jgi:hypothetical protein
MMSQIQPWSRNTHEKVNCSVHLRTGSIGGCENSETETKATSLGTTTDVSG